ncbi:MAG: molybdopterin-dependent oxidoreductase, partial [Anaerolineaceae bacterium]|nr:molybdopterin-dependent oxidoreductase [Anaerolineaceae bacterium]
DLVAEHQVLGFFIKRQQATGTKIIVTGSTTNRLLAKADVKLVENKCEYEDIFDAIIAAKSNDPEFNIIAAKTGLDPQLFDATVKILSEAEKPVIVYGGELANTGNSIALEKLIQFSELIGAPILGTKSNANSLAAAQLNMDTPFKSDGINAAFISLGDEIPTQKLTKELESIPFVAVHSAYSSHLTAKANVVLPAVNWSEEGGHYINLDGHIQTKQKALEPAEGVFDTVTVFNKLAHILGIQPKADCHARITTPIAPVEIKVP